MKKHTQLYKCIPQFAFRIFLLVRLIQRARLVLDFSLTLHFFHLLITTYYSGHVPTKFIWWALNVTTCCIMIFGGEIYLSRAEKER